MNNLLRRNPEKLSRNYIKWLKENFHNSRIYQTAQIRLLGRIGTIVLAAFVYPHFSFFPVHTFAYHHHWCFLFQLKNFSVLMPKSKSFSWQNREEIFTPATLVCVVGKFLLPPELHSKSPMKILFSTQTVSHTYEPMK